MIPWRRRHEAAHELVQLRRLVHHRLEERIDELALAYLAGMEDPIDLATAALRDELEALAPRFAEIRGTDEA